MDLLDAQSFYSDHDSQKPTDAFLRKVNMVSKTGRENRYYYQGDTAVYPYGRGTRSSDRVFEYFKNPQAYSVVESRIAATVMIVRDPNGFKSKVSERGLLDAPQVFMLHRVADMDFAPDALVFPGGCLDDCDFEPISNWAGPSPEQWGQTLGVDSDCARAIVVAAIRETFEECGVLLASDGNGHVGFADAAQSVAYRQALASHAISLSQMLAENGLTLRSDLLSPRARWITPITEPRRYDTFFFSALAPSGEQLDGDTSEADSYSWVYPADVLQRFEDGQVVLLPPTVHQLLQLKSASSAADFVNQVSLIEPVLCESAIIHGEAVAICPKA